MSDDTVAVHRILLNSYSLDTHFKGAFDPRDTRISVLYPPDFDDIEAQTLLVAMQRDPGSRQTFHLTAFIGSYKFLRFAEVAGLAGFDFHEANERVDLSDNVAFTANVCSLRSPISMKDTRALGLKERNGHLFARRPSCPGTGATLLAVAVNRKGVMGRTRRHKKRRAHKWARRGSHVNHSPCCQCYRLGMSQAQRQSLETFPQEEVCLTSKALVEHSSHSS